MGRNPFGRVRGVSEGEEGNKYIKLRSLTYGYKCNNAKIGKINTLTQEIEIKKFI